MPRPTPLLIAGDSLVEGVGAAGKRGWAQMVAELVPDTTVIGIGGFTVRDAIDRLRVEPLDDYKSLCLSLGLNDSRYRADLGKYEVPIEQFEMDLNELFAMLPTGASDRAILSLIPVDEARSMPLKEDKKYINRDIEQYDAIIRRVAPEYGVDLILVPDLRGDPADYADGVHPSDSGHAKIFAAVKHWLGI